ncbi:hypothetical protein [Nocardioides sp. KR10-350]|uniref:hypothetical protein n=1 Tax=Nocardioides cheoyonin TaxID=3156615 RepID=UPI0032B51BF5
MKPLRGSVAVLVSLFLAVAGLVLLSPSAAQAASASGWTSSSNGVLYDTSQKHRYGFSVSVPAAADDWDLEVTLVAPDGTDAGSDYKYGSNSKSASGYFWFFGSEMPGRYRVKAQLTWYDWDASSNWKHQVSLPTSSFTMRRPHSRTTLTVSDRTPRKGQIVRYTITLRDERPRGYFPTKYEYVVLQHKVGGAWVNYRWSKDVTSARGKVTGRARYEGRPVKLRAKAVASSWVGYTTSSSKIIRLHR